MATTSRASGRIFISYRHEDAAGDVRALKGELRTHFGRRRLFIDSDDIEPGDDIIAAIRQAIASCSVVLVVIGRDWLKILEARQQSRQADGPIDVVRMEVGTALESDHIIVVPVLVERARMPSEEDLPSDLRPLAHRHAIELRENRWPADVGYLIEILEKKGVGRFQRLVRLVSWLMAASLIVAGGLALVTQLPERLWIAPQPPGPVPTTTTTTTTKKEPEPDPPDQLSVLIDGATASYRAGRPRDALKDIREGLRLAPSNDLLLALRKTLLRDAQTAAGRAEQAAIAAGARRWARVEFSRATDLSTRAQVLLDGGDADGAVEQFWAVEAGFRSVATKAEAAAKEGARQAIDTVLEGFRAAYNKRDLNGIQQVFPKVQRDSMGRRIKNCKSVSLTFGAKSIELLSKGGAQAEVQSQYGCQPSAGKGLPAVTVSETYKFEQQPGGSWLIVQQSVAVPQ